MGYICTRCGGTNVACEAIVNPLYAFKVATAYFREQGMIPVFEDANCRLMKI